MPEPEQRCVYMRGHNRCNLKFNRDKRCIAGMKGGIEYHCEQHTPEREHTLSFDDEKWAWKAGMNALTQAFDYLANNEERKFHTSKKAQDHCDSRGKMGHYHFIPRSAESVLCILTHAFKYLGPKTESKPKFLDCGCGVGNVVIPANFVGFNAYGIEYDAITLARGRRLLEQFGMDPKRLMKGDILKFPKYHEYDLLYGYCPMSSSKLEDEFERKLRLGMKIGALISGLRFTKGCEEIGKERIYFEQLQLARYQTSVGIKIAHETD